MILSTICCFSRSFMKLSRAFLSFMMAAIMYVMISSAVILLNSHFLSMSTIFFQYSSSVSCSSCFVLKNCALLWNTFLAGNKVFLNSISKSGKLTCFNSRPHWVLMTSCLAFGPSAEMISPFIWYTVCGSIYSVPWSIISSRFRLYVKWMYSEICFHQIFGFIFLWNLFLCPMKSVSCICFVRSILLLSDCCLAWLIVPLCWMFLPLNWDQYWHPLCFVLFKLFTAPWNRLGRSCIGMLNNYEYK